MSDTGDIYRAMREADKQQRREEGIECADCKRLRPKCHASILLPGQKCKMHPFRAPRRTVPHRSSGNGRRAVDDLDDDVPF